MQYMMDEALSTNTYCFMVNQHNGAGLACITENCFTEMMLQGQESPGAPLEWTRADGRRVLFYGTNQLNLERLGAVIPKKNPQIKWVRVYLKGETDDE